MPHLNLADARIYYEVHGSGFPLLLIAPGGMRSAIPLWSNSPWDPIAHLSEHFQVIAMDQRNAGQSTGAVAAEHGWHTYANDQLALMDHLGASHFHTAGMCIGGPYCMGLAARAPERVAAVVLFQPIGLDDNRALFHDMFDQWAQPLAEAQHNDVDAAAWRQFRSNLFDGPFLFNLSEADVATMTTPTLILQGDDPYHPKLTSTTLAKLLPNGELLESWKPEAQQAQAQSQVLEFLRLHTPA
ncbi:MAG: alpha/beta fold hydrolase [Pseudomonadales bacterium]